MLRSIEAPLASLSYVQRGNLRVLAVAQTTPDGETQMVGAFLLQPHVPRVIVGELHDQRARVLRKLLRNLLHQLLLALDINRREELVLMNRLQQRFVRLFALVFRIGERRNRSQLPIERQLVGAAFGEFEQLLGGRHTLILVDGFWLWAWALS